MFCDDADYIGGRREQAPVYAFEAHLVHRIRPGLWVSADANWFTGGRQTIDGEKRDDQQKNVRMGVTVAFPFGGRNAMKLGYSTAARTRFGSDSEQLLVSYTLLLE